MANSAQKLLPATKSTLIKAPVAKITKETIKNIIKTLLEEGLTDKTLFNFNKTKK